MKRTFAIFFAFAFCFALLSSALPAHALGGSDAPRLSQSVYTPADGNCLYIYVPLSGRNLDCTVEICDSFGVPVYSVTRTGLSTNVQTYFWDARPAAGNAGGYRTDCYVSPGTYSVRVLVDEQGQRHENTLSVFITAAGEGAVFDETGIPNYTGVGLCDYMAEQLLEEIGVDGLSNYEKVRAIYTWIEANCYRESSAYPRPMDQNGEFYSGLSADSPECMAYAAQSDRLHELGLINYDVHGDLEVGMAEVMMRSRVGTCYEFSALFQVLLEHVGIECHVFGGYFHNSDGSSVIHKWNLLRLNGCYYWSDIRIDNASYERSGRSRLYYDYFLESDTAVWEKRHAWDAACYPEFSITAPALDTAELVPPASPAVGGRAPADYPLSAFPDLSPRKTVTTSASVILGGDIAYLLEAYNIDGYNYFKLRDIACLLAGSEVQFAVGWSEAENRITLTSGSAYSAAGGELGRQSLHDPIASPTASEILLDGEAVSLCAYFINDNNYFRLRDLAILFNFAVGWDEIANAVFLDPLSHYAE